MKCVQFVGKTVGYPRKQFAPALIICFYTHFSGTNFQRARKSGDAEVLEGFSFLGVVRLVRIAGVRKRRRTL